MGVSYHLVYQMRPFLSERSCAILVYQMRPFLSESIWVFLCWVDEGYICRLGSFCWFLWGFWVFLGFCQVRFVGFLGVFQGVFILSLYGEEFLQFEKSFGRVGERNAIYFVWGLSGLYVDLFIFYSVFQLWFSLFSFMQCFVGLVFFACFMLDLS